MASLFIPLFLFTLHVSSTPITEPGPVLASLLKRDNACEPGHVPILYDKEYGTGDCPPKYTLQGDGSCPVKVSEGPCISYCEIRQNFYYGEEVPLDNGFCHGPLTCSIADAKTKTYTWNIGGSITASIKSVLNIGVTGGFSDATTTTQTRTTSVNLKDKQCGYFTYLPILHDSCGSLTEATYIGGPEWCIDPKTTGNYCITNPYKSADGKQVLGDTIFVYTDCGNHQRLPAESQDPAYNHPGVAQPQNAFTTFSQDWDCVLSPQCQTPDGYAIDPSCTWQFAGSAGGGPGNGP
ncbi:uncharacterized protein KY384_000457 [Bacidia gigantensis]|uniref:uncharacterized protein n=1 Tax=Bacidia gigantensis TaxID=2732470 RepID=UPI001D0512DD|nr:uncharacterized protein KY384_000457 [Bacidia gigantensis]KAG8525697.1 hypothetical protein KY384_000457 [Bacidia gigantensis]